MFGRPFQLSLAILLGLLLLLGAIVVIGNRATTQQMARAQAEAYMLAEQLGYTPEAQLTYRVEKWDANLVTGSAKCVAVLYYTTPNPLNEFEETLMQVDIKLRKPNFNNATNHIFAELPLIVNGINGRQIENRARFAPLREHWWEATNKNLGESEDIYFYEVDGVDYQLAYSRQPITQNIVAIQVEAGRFPVWRANCG
jgi:hypothetical protein